ncbi:Outer membrane protein (OmpH-like) [Durusdinium trenchii]|uniref:Outer membrane protein (OmpH-like) n=1 Tax=Durusdinium trenchii TaxID=1381693 RepID=A0ABP0LFJ6_9DINO
MNKSISTFALACIGLLSIGCNQMVQPAPTATTTDSSAGIAIIDLDEVARQLGSDKQIVNSIKQRQAALNGKLVELAQNYTTEFNKQKEVIEAQPESNEGAVQLASYEKQVNQRFNTAKAQARQNLTQHRSKLIQQFRDAVRPAARKVADDRGLSIIVTKHDNFYDYDAECDITQEVVEVLRASAAAKKTAAAKPASQNG